MLEVNSNARSATSLHRKKELQILPFSNLKRRILTLDSQAYSMLGVLHEMLQWNDCCLYCRKMQCEFNVYKTFLQGNFLQEKFPYNERMGHLKKCEGIYECKFCDTKTQVKDNHKSECIGYLQEKLKKMEDLIQDRISLRGKITN